MAVKELTISPFDAFKKDESATMLLKREIERNGFSTKANYILSIITKLIADDEKKLYQRIPQEALGGLSKGGRRNVEASIVARTGESPVRRDRKGFEDEPLTDDTFLRWDYQEKALESWAHADGCWYADVIQALESKYGKEISHGTEARVFYDPDGYAVKAISSLFDQQETLTRIALTNFLFPATGLELLGLGRNAEGEFCFIVKQPFIKGERVDTPEVMIDALEAFEKVGEDNQNNNPFYGTPLYLLGDLHDRNLLKDSYGNIQVIDCNVFLNTPELGKGGEWIIPDLQYSEKNINELNAIIDGFLPKKSDFIKTAQIIDKIEDDFSDTLLKTGRYPNPVTLTLKNGQQKTYRFQSSSVINPQTNLPEKLLYIEEEKLQQLLAFHGLKPEEARYFDLEKGKVLPIKSQSSLSKEKANAIRHSRF